MICPQTKAECAHNCSAWMISCKEAVKPSLPTLAEIEGLAVAYGNACVNFFGSGHGSPDAHFAALMAAIRAYGRE